MAVEKDCRTSLWKSAEGKSGFLIISYFSFFFKKLFSEKHGPQCS